MGHGNDGHGHGQGCSRGQGRGRGTCEPNVPPQAEVDKCVHITKTYYPPDVYAKFTPAEKHKLWQNQKCQRERTAGGRMPPDPNSNRSHLAKMASNMSVDRDFEQYSNPDQCRIHFVDDDPDDDHQGNRSNPALAHQAPAVKKPHGNDDWGKPRST